MNRALAILFLVLAASLAAADEPPYPKGVSVQTLEGLRCHLIVPDDHDSAKEHSLVVVLHGAGGEERSMALTLQPLAKEGFVVLAPKSRGPTWSTPDLKAVKRILTHLREVLSVGEKRMHCMGYSNGGWNLGPIAFDEDLHMVSACWVAAGCSGGKVPRRAKREMGAMALAGTEDPNRNAAESTVTVLEDKVRCVECRLQPNLGHKFPRELLPYYFYWVKVMDGRFVPGEDLSFDWTADPEAARQRMETQKLGALLYFYSKEDGENEQARRVQNEVFFDRYVRHFGSQLVAIKLERAEHEDLFEELRLRATPAIAVLAHDFDVSKSFEGKRIKASSLAGALRKIAPDKRVPK
jgi:dienelactone hydrolase